MHPSHLGSLATPRLSPPILLFMAQYVASWSLHEYCIDSISWLLYSLPDQVFIIPPTPTHPTKKPFQLKTGSLQHLKELTFIIVGLKFFHLIYFKNGFRQIYSGFCSKIFWISYIWDELIYINATSCDTILYLWISWQNIFQKYCLW